MAEIQQITEYYESLRSEAQIRAAENSARARENADYKCADDRLSAIEHDLAFAEIRGDECAVTALEKEKDDLTLRRSNILNKLGMRVTDILPDYRCKICNDTGYAGKNRCKCYEFALKAVSSNRIGIPPDKLPKFKLPDVGDEKLKQCYEKVQVYIDKFPNNKTGNIILVGQTGTGKTYLAASIASAISQKGYDAVFVSSFAMNNAFIEYHSLFNGDRFKNMQTLMNAELLVIDDLGSEQLLKNITAEYLLNLINERLLNSAPFIITSNLSPLEIMDRYGERVYSRIFKKDVSKIIKLNGDDMRTKKN